MIDIIKITIIVVLLNLILPLLAKPFATVEEVDPQRGAASLSLKGQIMHMLVHHAQVPFTSSLIVATLIIVAYMLSSLIPKF